MASLRQPIPAHPPIPEQRNQNRARSIAPFDSNTHSTGKTYVQTRVLGIKATTSRISTDPGERRAPILDLKLVASLTQGLIDGISTTVFNNLVNLHRELPCTHDFTLRNNTLPNTLLLQLRYLCLEVTDSTCPGGADNCFILEDEDRENNSDYPRSKLQKKYLVRKYSLSSVRWSVDFRTWNL